MIIKSAAIKTSDGFIITGKNHSECFKEAIDKHPTRGAVQGFITDMNWFVDRRVALDIANHAGQIKHKHPPLNILLSEDLK